jgi:NAD(P)-dependent dehydrogenase (short-subunit alcohol dehydrogenase family)
MSRAAVVTGGGSGIGRGVCERFASLGYGVVAADRDLASAEETARGIVAAQPEAQVLPVGVDVRSEEDVARMVAATLERFGRLDVLVTCAGIGVQKPALDTTVADFEAILGVNVIGTFLCAQHAARVMVDANWGRIVTISSGAGIKGIPGRVAYGSSKGAVITMTRVLATELAPYGITVNCVAPGPIETAMVKTMHTAATRAALTATVPMHRYGTVEEIAAAVTFLASDDASFITGDILVADGGTTSAGPLFDPS